MKKLYSYIKSEESLILENGINGNKIFIYLKDNYFYVNQDYIRSFKFSIRRAKNTFNIGDIDQLSRIIINNIKNIYLEKKNENLFFLSVSYQLTGFANLICTKKIKLREINNFLTILNTDSQDIIIKKQNEKIISLLNKLDAFEKNHEEPNTDDELILKIK